MYAFEYHRPTSVREAAALASKAEDIKFLAGGHTLLPTMKMRLAAPANLVDLGQIAALRAVGIRVVVQDTVIGEIVCVGGPGVEQTNGRAAPVLVPPPAA